MNENMPGSEVTELKKILQRSFKNCVCVHVCVRAHAHAHGCICHVLFSPEPEKDLSMTRREEFLILYLYRKKLLFQNFLYFR